MPVDPAILTPAVMAQLDSRGYFPRQEHEAGYLQPIDRVTAETMARAYLDDSAGALSAAWSEAHGASIAVDRLVRCTPTLYASSAYDVVEMGLHFVQRRYYVGRYLVQYCSRAGVPQLLVAVAVEDWLLDSPGNAPDHTIRVHPVPIELSTQMIVTPERAAQLAAARTGRRVAAIPELILPRFVPTIWQARWLVQLETPVAVAGTRTYESDTLSAVLVGVDEIGYGLATVVLRPRLRATMAERIDSITGSGPDGFDYYTARLGLPRGVETFVLAP